MIIAGFGWRGPQSRFGRLLNALVVLDRAYVNKGEHSLGDLL